MEHILSFIEVQLTNPKVSIEEMYAGLEEVQQYNLAGLIVPPFWVKKLYRDWGAGNSAILGTTIGFPYGYQRTEVKQLEIETALQDGATDIEVMLNTSAWFSTQHNWVKIELARLGKLIHQREAFFTAAIDATHFGTPDLQKAVKDAINAGVDYIKIYQPFSLVRTLEIKQWIPDSVGLKVIADKATPEEKQQLIAAGIERICLAEFRSE